MKSFHPKTVRPDIKGRITLGSLAHGISGFTLTVDQNHRIILEPLVEIPAREKWLFENKEALARVQQGLKEARENKLIKRGSFTKYLDEEID